MPFVELSAELVTVARALASYAELSVLDATVGPAAARYLAEATDRARTLDNALRARGLSLVYPDPLAGFAMGTGQGLIYQNDPPQADIWSTLAVQITRANGETEPKAPIVTSTGQVFRRVRSNNLTMLQPPTPRPVVDDCEGLSSLLSVVFLALGYKRVWSTLGQPQEGGMGHNWLVVEGDGPFGDAGSHTVVDASALCGMARPPAWLYDHPRQASAQVRPAQELLSLAHEGAFPKPLSVRSEPSVPDWMMS